MAMSDADRELMELQRSAATQGHAAGLPSGPAAADPSTITTWQARRAAQREAWGQFVANGPIHIGNALAFNAGSQVPLEHVIKYQLEEQNLVNRVATPEMAQVGKVFDNDDDYYAANAHLDRNAPGAVPELHPAALDPRGGAAHLDTEGRHGAVVGTSAPADVDGDEAHRARAGAVAAAGAAQKVPQDEPDPNDKGNAPKASAPKRAPAGEDK